MVALLKGGATLFVGAGSGAAESGSETDVFALTTVCSTDEGIGSGREGSVGGTEWSRDHRWITGIVFRGPGSEPVDGNGPCFFVEVTTAEVRRRKRESPASRDIVPRRRRPEGEVESTDEEAPSSDRLDSGAGVQKGAEEGAVSRAVINLGSGGGNPQYNADNTSARRFVSCL